jgi:hypothetical protein
VWHHGAHASAPAAPLLRLHARERRRIVGRSTPSARMDLRAWIGRHGLGPAVVPSRCSRLLLQARSGRRRQRRMSAEHAIRPDDGMVRRHVVRRLHASGRGRRSIILARRVWCEGVAPYHQHKGPGIADLRALRDDQMRSALDHIPVMMALSITRCGRVMVKRGMGKTVFADPRCDRPPALSQRRSSRRGRLRERPPADGDIVVAERSRVRRSAARCPSPRAVDRHKSLRPLPDKWHGAADAELPMPATSISRSRRMSAKCFASAPRSFAGSDR